MAAVANCELPSGYNYNRPSIGGGSSAGGSSLGSGGGYQQVGIGPSTNEGLNIDPQLLDQIRQILLKEESKSGSGGAGFSAPSSQYGAPQPEYGPPGRPQQRVVGIVLENTIPSIQVAQYLGQSQEAGGYPSGPSFGGSAPQISAPSGSYAAPSGGYAAPSSSYAAPSSSYAAPAPQRPSSNYGAPF